MTFEGYHEPRVVCGKSALLVNETMLKKKINKLMDFTASAWLQIVFVTGDDLVGLR